MKKIAFFLKKNFFKPKIIEMNDKCNECKEKIFFGWKCKNFEGRKTCETCMLTWFRKC